jgi:hypothetical protein
MEDTLKKRYIFKKIYIYNIDKYVINRNLFNDEKLDIVFIIRCLLLWH